jgi:hypothetical protein
LDPGDFGGFRLWRLPACGLDTFLLDHHLRLYQRFDLDTAFGLLDQRRLLLLDGGIIRREGRRVKKKDQS